MIETMTLDQYVQEHGIGEIEVLKVEAEGAEPEVLRGATQTLPKCRYVTVDCGRERGVDRESTLRDVCNILFDCGFFIVDCEIPRCGILFERRASECARAA